MESITRLPQQRNITEIIPQKVIREWVHAKNWEQDKLLKAGNKVIDCLSESIVKHYFSDKNGWGSAIHSNLSVSEKQDIEGSRKKEKFLLYWTIERGVNKIHLPVVTIHGVDNNSTRYAVDKDGNTYLMYEKWFNGGKCDLARVELYSRDGENERLVNLLDKYNFIDRTYEVPPSQLQVELKDVSCQIVRPKRISAYYPDPRFKESSVKGLTWKLEKHAATSILPQFVINDLGLLEYNR